MDETTKKQLQFLGLRYLQENWDNILKEPQKKQPSYQRFLTDIIEKEHMDKKERSRLYRIKKANIPELWVMETFPFSKQPRLKKKLVIELYDSLRYITEKQELIFIGPTGCGKSGLATAFLVHAINQGYRGYFIDFGQLIRQLYQSKADHSEHKLIRRFQAYDALLVDEIGYDHLEKEQAGLFFDLMKARNKKRTTILTTQFGFEEWGSFLHNDHLTAALIDRITVNCTIFNMKDCISVRPNNTIQATNNHEAQAKDK